MFICYDAPNSENVVKLYVPTWSIFAGPFTYMQLKIMDLKRAVIINHCYKK